MPILLPSLTLRIQRGISTLTRQNLAHLLFKPSSIVISRHSSIIPTCGIGMNSKHLAKGSAFPPLQDGKMRIYNMRFCPYAQRAILVAEALEVPHDIVNVNLKEKPEWLLERNPGGKVPTIETAKGPLYESLIVADYLDAIYKPERPLNCPEPYQRALDRIWIENFNKVISIYYKMLLGRENEELVKGLLTEFSEALAPFEKELLRRDTLYYAGNLKPGMLDYMIWPWFERMPLLKVFFPNLYDYELAKENNPRLEKWRKAMKEDSAVKSSYLSTEDHNKHVQTFLAGAPDYDILLK